MSIADPKVDSVISCDEIASNAQVRWTLIKGAQYLSIRDMIMCVCCKDSNYSGQIWRNIGSDKKEELRQFIENYQFAGSGQSPQPVITFSGAVRLIMFLPGEAAKRHRSAFAKILQRYYSGDGSLFEEIRTNAVSTSPIQQMARASLDYWDETEHRIKKARSAMQDLGEQSSMICRDVQETISGIEKIIEWKKEMYSMDQNERNQQKQHAIDMGNQQKQHVLEMAQVQVQAMQIIAQSTPVAQEKSISVEEPEVVVADEVVGCKQWVMGFLHRQGIIRGEIKDAIYNRILYQLRRYYPSVQITPKKGVLYLKVADLRVVEDIFNKVSILFIELIVSYSLHFFR